MSSTFVCEICGKVFYTKRALAVHKGLAHNPYRARPVRRRVVLKRAYVKMPDAYFDGLKELARREHKTVSELIRASLADLITWELPIHKNNTSKPEAGE